MSMRLAAIAGSAFVLTACSAAGGEAETIETQASSSTVAAESDAPRSSPGITGAAAGASQNLPQDPPPIAPARTDFELDGQLTQGGWIRGFAPSGAVSLTLDGQEVAQATDGSFFAAFDRDAGAIAVLRAQTRSGATTKTLNILPREWQIERVNVARRSGGPSAAFMKRRRPELAQIVAAREIRSDSQGWSQDFVWPVKGRISGRFGSQRIYRGEPGSYHSGLDIATGESGTPFVAPADGVVILATKAPFSLEGRLLMIDHGMGLNSAFLHCSKIVVEAGDVVRQGQYIGNIGATGRATGPHLHWGLKWNKARLDPLLFVGPM